MTLQGLCWPRGGSITSPSSLRTLQHISAFVAGGNAGYALGLFLAYNMTTPVLIHSSLAITGWALAVLPEPAHD